MDLPDTEEGTELTVLPLSENFKELTRLAGWIAEVKLRLELTLQRLALEILGVKEFDRVSEPSSPLQAFLSCLCLLYSASSAKISSRMSF